MKSGLRILVADDEAGIREAISHILGKEGHDVTESANGTEAYALFKTAPFPLVIADIVMQGMGGLELLKNIKQTHPETEVALITSYASVETATAALRLGALDYLMKSYDNLSALPEVAVRAGEKVRRAQEQRNTMESLMKMKAALEQTQRSLKDNAVLDDFTGLYNRRYFQEILEGELNRSAYFKRNFSLVLFTVETGASGRMLGAPLFWDLAQAVKQRLRKSDIIVRYEENMFAVILPETARVGAECVVKNIVQLMASGSALSPEHGEAVDLTVAAGSSVYPEDGSDCDALVRFAREALDLNRS